jgi:hypothetical protein
MSLTASTIIFRALFNQSPIREAVVSSFSQLHEDLLAQKRNRSQLFELEKDAMIAERRARGIEFFATMNLPRRARKDVIILPVTVNIRAARINRRRGMYSQEKR